jgi:acetolactate synthase-1/2/3 large subunit
MSNSKTVAELFADFIEREGVEYVFTVPGGTIVPLLEAISRRRSVQLIVAKDETGAGYAADGYAWATGKPGIVLTIGGPGATNALTALCCSSAQGHPLILVSGEVGSESMGRRAAQDSSDLAIDVLSMSRAATALSVAVSSAAKAPQAFGEAFRRALSLRRPVHLAIPLDVQRAPVLPGHELSSRQRVTGHRSCDLRAMREAASLLGAAERPAILAGTGARGAEAELLALAEALDAPVATTCSAKGVFPETHRLALGVFSFGATERARSVLTSAGVDVLCAVGTGLGEFATMNYSAALAPSRALIQIDDDPSVFGRNYDALAVLGDARATLSALLTELAPLEPEWTRPRQWPSRISVAELLALDPKAATRPGLVRPEQLMNELQRALPRQACVVADIGTSCLFVANHLRLAPPQRCYIPMAWSCMAHPLAASLGVRLGSKLPTVCVTGDAAFLSKGLELHAAVEAGIGGLVWIVLSNGGHGLVRMGMAKLLGENHQVENGTFRIAPNAAEIARAVGALGQRVTALSELPAALASGLSAKLPMVIDVSIDPNVEPPMADRIQGLRTPDRERTSKLEDA